MNKPKAGTNVQVVIRYDSPCLPALFPNEPNTLTFEGVVLHSLPEDDKDTFRMTGEPRIPTRVIAMKHVISINGINVDHSSEPVQPKTKTEVVKGSKGDEYVVTVDEHGNAKCTCKGFGYRGKCSHINQVLGESK